MNNFLVSPQRRTDHISDGFSDFIKTRPDSAVLISISILGCRSMPSNSIAPAQFCPPILSPNTQTVANESIAFWEPGILDEFTITFDSGVQTLSNICCSAALTFQTGRLFWLFCCSVARETLAVCVGSPVLLAHPPIKTILINVTRLRNLRNFMLFPIDLIKQNIK